MIDKISIHFHLIVLKPAFTFVPFFADVRSDIDGERSSLPNVQTSFHVRKEAGRAARYCPCKIVSTFSLSDKLPL